MTAVAEAPRVLCHGRPPEWWDVGDEGNRLARALCRVCPARDGDQCDAGQPDPHPVGVIRAGIPYSDAGDRMPLCPACRGPLHGYRGGGLTACTRCAVPDVPIPDPQQVLRWRIRELWADGVSDKRIAPIVRRTPRTICAIRREAGWVRPVAETRAAKARASIRKAA